MNLSSIATNIIALKNADLQLRDRLIEEGKLSDGYNEEMASLHNRNAAVLEEIIDQIGYPTIGKVGAEGNEAAWLVIQHAIGQPIFMKKCMLLLELAVNEGKANKRDLAYLSDRIAVFEGRVQIYGTQFDWDENGDLSPNPYDDKIKVNDRRKSIGLNTLDEQTEIIRQTAKKENQRPPKDFETRRKAYDDWRRSVGWIR